MPDETKTALLRALLAYRSPLPVGTPNPSDPSWYRYGNASLKGTGLLGPQTNQQGQGMSEYSIGVPMNGQETEIPSMVPTLSPQELQGILTNGAITPAIKSKATNYAYARQSRGLPPFAGNDEPIMPVPPMSLGK